MKWGTIEHPKTQPLVDELGVELLMVVGLLEALWHFAARYAPQGDVGRFSNAGIARGVYWPHDPDQLIAAMVKTRWLCEDPDHRLLIHDWPDHVERYVRLSLGRMGLKPLGCAHARAAAPPTDKTALAPSLADAHRGANVCAPEVEVARTRHALPSQAKPCLSPAQPQPSDGDGQKRATEMAERNDGPDGLVDLMTAIGVVRHVAEKAAVRYKPRRICEVVRDAKADPKVQDKAAWTVHCLHQRSALDDLTPAARAEREVDFIRRGRQRAPGDTSAPVGPIVAREAAAAAQGGAP